MGWRLAMVRIAFSSIWLFQHVDPFVILDHPVGQRGVAPRQRIDGIGELLLGQAAHLRQHLLRCRQVVVVGLDDVVGHDVLRDGLSRSGR